MAVRSLLQHKLRTLLSMLGVIFGVMAVFAMIAIGQGAKKHVVDQIEQLGVKNIYVKSIPLTEAQLIKARERHSRGLNESDMRRIQRACRQVQSISALKELSVSIQSLGKEVTPQVVACTVNYVQMQNLRLASGRFIADQDLAKRNQVCVLGSQTAAWLGSDGRVDRLIRIEDQLFKVIGLLKRIDQKAAETSAVSIRNFNEMVFLPLGAESALATRSRRKTKPHSDLTEIVVAIDLARHVRPAGRIIQRILEAAHHNVLDYQLIIPQELLARAKKTQRTFNFVLGAIASVSLLVGGIGIMNIMLATVLERTLEIGIRRAVGASRFHIVLQFLTESVILTCCGGIVGLVAGFGAIWAIAAMGGWQTLITLWAIMLPLVMSLLVGIFFGLYPAYTAAKMDPIAALRAE
ncbi:MAG: ABC transporter permease [Deltaproteobacteria bacterium]|nr:ABC transporter permease [Deltaproteobacteria bacterium]